MRIKTLEKKVDRLCKKNRGVPVITGNTLHFFSHENWLRRGRYDVTWAKATIIQKKAARNSILKMENQDHARVWLASALEELRLDCRPAWSYMHHTSGVNSCIVLNGHYAQRGFVRDGVLLVYKTKEGVVSAPFQKEIDALNAQQRL